MLRTRGTSYSSTLFGKNVCTSLCSFYIFLYSLDKGYLPPDFPRFTEFKDDLNVQFCISCLL